jgi:hypothetical protein
MRTKLLLLLLAISVAGFAQVQLPDTPAGRQMGAWLQAFDGGDRAAFLAFLEKNYPSRAKNIDRDMDFRKMAQERDSDQFARMTVEVAAVDPYAITQIGIRAIPRPAEFPLSKFSQGELLAALKTKLEKDSAAGNFSGDVLLASRGKQVFEEAYGLADLRRGRLTRSILGFGLGR